MKKFTLLALAALAFGSAMADTEIYGIKTSDPNAANDARHYYRIRNMRAMRLDYTNKHVIGQNGDSIGFDGAVTTIDSLLYWFEGMDGWDESIDGYPVYEGNEQARITKAAGKDGNAYMGLSALGGNWWLSFSGQDEIKSHHTEYWWFEDGNDDNAAPNSLYIHNAVIGGIVSGTARQVADLAGNKRSNMDFKDSTLKGANKRNHRYYVLPVKPAFEARSTDEVNWVDSILGQNADPEFGLKPSLTPEELEKSYALCKNPTITQKGQPINANNPDGPTNDGDCLDMNNYVNYKYTGWKWDEEAGDTARNENGDPLKYNYGFAGVDRTWTPIQDNGSNKNHWVNNGSIFLFEEAETSKAVEAIDAYQEKITAELKRGAVEAGKGKMAVAANTLKGWAHVPAIFTEANKSTLNAAAKELLAWNGDGVDVEINEPSDIDKYADAVEALADKKLAEMAQLVGTGCKVRFQNLLNYRDHVDWLEGNYDDKWEVGNAFISSAGDITYRKDGVAYPIEEDNCQGWGIEPRLDGEDDPYCVWELIPVKGSYRFLLYNDATGHYIRKHLNMYDYVNGEEWLDNSCDEISWGETDDVDLAAEFSIIGCPTDEDPYTMDAEREEHYLDYMDQEIVDEGVTNHVQLQAQWIKPTYNTTTGKWDEVLETGDIHRGSGSSCYRFINYGTTTGSFLADSNTFRVILDEAGSGINEVAAEIMANSGIYDLQGRKVNNTVKGGIYIVNGKKTLVK